MVRCGRPCGGASRGGRHDTAGPVAFSAGGGGSCDPWEQGSSLRRDTSAAAPQAHMDPSRAVSAETDQAQDPAPVGLSDVQAGPLDLGHECHAQTAPLVLRPHGGFRQGASHDQRKVLDRVPVDRLHSACTHNHEAVATSRATVLAMSRRMRHAKPPKPCTLCGHRVSRAILPLEPSPMPSLPPALAPGVDQPPTPGQLNGRARFGNIVRAERSAAGAKSRRARATGRPLDFVHPERSRGLGATGPIANRARWFSTLEVQPHLVWLGIAVGCETMGSASSSSWMQTEARLTT